MEGQTRRSIEPVQSSFPQPFDGFTTTSVVLTMPSVALKNGLTLSYVQHGHPTGPALVMLPGPTDSWWSYQLVIDHLPPSVRAVAVSQRGHGDSDKPTTGYRVEDFATDVVPFLDALAIERAVLVGHSASGLVVRRVVLDSPDRVSGLVLEATPVSLRGHVGLDTFVRSTVSKLQDVVDLDFVRSFVVATSSERISAAQLDGFVTEVAKVPGRVWRETFLELLRYDDTDELGFISAPTLLIWGDADVVVDREQQNELLRRIPGAQLLVYRGVGHTPRWEDPTRFAKDLAMFVHQVAT
jgi:non-heme chloroperoxidase